MFSSNLLTTEDRILLNTANQTKSSHHKDTFIGNVDALHRQEGQPSLMLAEDVFLMELLQQERNKKAHR